MDLLRSIYEFFGVPYPRVSLVVVTILGAAAAFSIWSFAARQVEKDRRTSAPSSEEPKPGSEAVSGKAPSAQGKKKRKQEAPQVDQHSTGANSPNVVTGDGSNVDINGKQEK